MKKLPIYGITDFLSKKQDAHFYAKDLKTHLIDHQFVNLPHRHNTFIVVLFTKGTGEHQIDFSTYKVLPGSIFLIKPGQAHCWTLSPDVDGFVFFHTEEFFNGIYINQKIDDFPFFYLSSNYPVVYSSKKELPKITSLLDEINSEYKEQSIFRIQKLQTLITQTYIELSRIYIESEITIKNRTRSYLKIKHLLKLIDENFKDKKSAFEYAEMLHMSTRHLSRICQETLGKNTSSLISERIILEAKRLLLHSDVSISSIAAELGFEDYSYFIRLFKKNEKKTPKEFQSYSKVI